MTLSSKSYFNREDNHPIHMNVTLYSSYAVQSVLKITNLLFCAQQTKVL